MRKIMKFHTGRGGRYYNAGFVTFVGFEEITKELNNYTYLEEEGKLFDDTGSEVIDFEFNEDGSGYINSDYEYDTTECVWSDELSNKQISAVARAMDEHYWSDNNDLYQILKQ
jgi:hypothetical protein